MSDKPQPDLMQLTLGEVLERVLAGRVSDEAGWVNIRDERWPWRRILAAARRGECQVSKVGRQLLMRREELDRFLEQHRIRPKRIEPANDVERSPLADDVAAILRNKGYRRRR